MAADSKQGRARLLALAIPVAGVGLTLAFLGTVQAVIDPASLHSVAVSQQRREAAEAQRHAALEARFGRPGSELDARSLARGKEFFGQSCAACHGADGRGIAVLGGKDLVESDFVTQQGDAELGRFIAAGREIEDPLNTTKMPMPPRGGNPDLTDAQVADIVTYLRGLQDPRRLPAEPLPVVVLPPEPEPEPVVVAQAPAAAESGAPAQAEAPVAAAEQVALDPEAVKRGKRAYMSCLACHGRDGTGVKGTGKDLIHSEFMLQSSDQELVDFIKVGRGPGDPANTTGIAMPPKGGNPALKDAQIQDIVIYLRSLQQAAGAKG